ncbi:Isochorismatase family protein [Penicillium manginii]|jgi:nicotinamidase-related amidase|uniref:Isochorismatase family protein n=1 Tax=Penicillium manginii TaxID=203109 RepID=UPI0025490120|nr:Isochorismatase family protein [Penicillium manginii]KAJ5750597.1 Isochorismatase family protein [Penicillium manginii]
MGATTLLILDIQNGIVDIFDKFITEPYLERLVKTIAAARNESINIIYVVTAFRQGYPDTHPLNASTGPVTAAGKYQEASADVQLHPAVQPLPTEPIITKRRVSAFMSTELDLLLRCSGTDHLVVAGIATSGAVLSTIRQAQDLDFHITVLRDLCLDRDEEVHRVLIDKVFGRKTDVFNAHEWVYRIKGLASS